MKTIEETFINMNKKSTALKGELIMKAQELLDQKAKRLEGVTEKVVVTDCGMEATIIYKVVDGKDYLKALEVLKKEEFGEKISIPGNNPGLEDLLVRVERAENCNPQWSLIESKQRRIMLEKEVLYCKAVIERKEFLMKEKEKEPLEIMLDNVGPGHILCPDDKEVYDLVECILEPDTGFIDHDRYRNELKRRVDLMVDVMEERCNYTVADKLHKIDSEEFYNL